MNSLMPEVRTALVAAARQRARPRRRLLRRTGALSAAAVLAGGTAVAATSWRPFAGEQRAPTVAREAAPADQVAALAVLRREQRAADRSPRVTAALSVLGRSEDRGVRLGDVRLLAQLPRGGALVLAPLQRTGRDDPGSPSTIRRDVLCVLHSAPQITAKACGTTRDLYAGDIAGSASTGGTFSVVGKRADGPPMRFYMLVPDHVARVEATLRDGSAHLLNVRNNAITLPLDDIRLVSNIQTRWLDGERSPDRQG